MECALCKSNCDLSKSHILSEFIYESSQLYDEHHKYHIVSTDPEIRSKKAPKGIYQKLLCPNCEKYLRDFENEASIKLRDLQNKAKGATEKFIFDTFDYTSFKIFNLSLLWRASISNRPEFQSFDLGAHNETLREMILNSSPGETYDYGFFAICTPEKIELTKEMIVPPEYIDDFLGHQAVRIIYFGFFWIFIIPNGQQSIPVDLKQRLYSKDGSLTVLVDKHRMNKFLKTFAIKLKESGKI